MNTAELERQRLEQIRYALEHWLKRAEREQKERNDATGISTDARGEARKAAAGRFGRNTPASNRPVWLF